jgi:hypothetical protein
LTHPIPRPYCEPETQALDGYFSQARDIGRNDEALAASQRRLDTPRLLASERSAALAMVVWGHVDSSDYDSALEATRAAIVQRKPGVPATNFGHAAAGCRRWWRVWDSWQGKLGPRAQRDVLVEDVLALLWRLTPRDNGLSWAYNGAGERIHVLTCAPH